MERLLRTSTVSSMNEGRVLTIGLMTESMNLEAGSVSVPFCEHIGRPLGASKGGYKSRGNVWTLFGQSICTSQRLLRQHALEPTL